MTEQLIKRLHDLAQSGDDVTHDADSLIGFFQVFRPDGSALAGLFDDFDCGQDLHRRLDDLYVTAGEDRRPEGGRDAYFLVRNPARIDPIDAQILAGQWLTKIRELAKVIGDQPIAEVLDTLPTIRVLEGKAPKHPKDPQEQSRLLKAMQTNSATLTERISGADSHAIVLRQAYYFIACDAMVRDHLMWPLYAQAVEIHEPFAEYFQLWKHGAKFRFFNDRQVDLYLPRQLD